MELIIYSLRTVSYAIIEPNYLFLLVVLGVVFYFKNKKISLMQRMTIGEVINSPLELTLSQIALGIIAGAIISVVLSILGVIFNENSGIEIMFMISIFLIFIKKRYICFAYSGAILGLISIISNLIANYTGYQSYINVNIVSLMVFVGVMHIVEGILVIFDGSRGAVPVFTNKENKIIGGFAYNRYWIMPVALFIAITSNISSVMTSGVETPNWWPIINRSENLTLLASAIIASIPLYGVIGFRTVSFTKEKHIKPIYSGISILIFGTLLTIISQLASLGLIGQIVVVVFAPLGHELMLKIQNKVENNGEYIYVSDDEGISVLEVAKNAPAYECGIRRGDKIIEINNQKIISEVDIFNIVKGSFTEINFKIKKLSGEIIDLKVFPNKKRLGILVVPRAVKKENAIKIDNDNFKKILEEMKRKQ